jgi:hypothetical protein
MVCRIAFYHIPILIVLSSGTYLRFEGNYGHNATDVLYIAFTGSDAVPGADGAAWNASSAGAFEDSVKSLGDKLVARIGGSGGGTAFATTASTTAASTVAASGSSGPLSCRAYRMIYYICCYIIIEYFGLAINRII